MKLRRLRRKEALGLRCKPSVTAVGSVEHLKLSAGLSETPMGSVDVRPCDQKGQELHRMFHQPFNCAKYSKSISAAALDGSQPALQLALPTRP